MQENIKRRKFFHEDISTLINNDIGYLISPTIINEKNLRIKELTKELEIVYKEKIDLYNELEALKEKHSKLIEIIEQYVYNNNLYFSFNDYYSN